jgi:hypothetical protein
MERWSRLAPKGDQNGVQAWVPGRDVSAAVCALSEVLDRCVVGAELSFGEHVARADVECHPSYQSAHPPRL